MVISQYGPHHVSSWKVKKAVSDKSVSIVEVIGGTLEHAFVLCFSFAVLERWWRSSRDGGPRGPGGNGSINTFHKLAGYPT